MIFRQIVVTLGCTFVLMGCLFLASIAKVMLGPRLWWFGLALCLIGSAGAVTGIIGIWVAPSA